jgi:hypothetical protein
MTLRAHAHAHARMRCALPSRTAVCDHEQIVIVRAELDFESAGAKASSAAYDRFANSINFALLAPLTKPNVKELLTVIAAHCDAMPLPHYDACRQGCGCWWTYSPKPTQLGPFIVCLGNWLLFPLCCFLPPCAEAPTRINEADVDADTGIPVVAADSD